MCGRLRRPSKRMACTPGLCHVSPLVFLSNISLRGSIFLPRNPSFVLASLACAQCLQMGHAWQRVCGLQGSKRVVHLMRDASRTAADLEALNHTSTFSFHYGSRCGVLSRSSWSFQCDRYPDCAWGLSMSTRGWLSGHDAISSVWRRETGRLLWPLSGPSNELSVGPSEPRQTSKPLDRFGMVVTVVLASEGTTGGWDTTRLPGEIRSAEVPLWSPP